MLSLWVPPLLWMGLIFWASSIPGLQSGLEMDWFLRKCAHAAEYFVLTGLLHRAFAGTLRSRSRSAWLLFSAATALAYAISDEVHQSFVPQRSGTVLDVFIDAAGIALFCALLLFTQNREVKNARR